jgi:hypothetical protein
MLVLSIALALFFVPFGVLQNAILGSTTAAKLILPTVFVTLLVIRLGRLKLHPNFWLITAFVVSTTPSFVLSDKYIDIAPNLFSYIMLFVLLRNTLSQVEDLRTLFAAYFSGLVVVSSLAMIAYVFGADAGDAVGKPLVQTWYEMQIILGTQDNPNGFATLLVVGVPIALFLRQTTASRSMRRVYASSALLFIAVIALTFSRSAIVGAIVACALMVYFDKSRSVLGLHVLIAVLIALGVIGAVLVVLFGVLGMTGDAVGAGAEMSILSNKELSQGYRVQVAKLYIPLSVESPLFGIGFGNLAPLMEQRIGLHNNAHNIIFGIAIEFGLIAGLLFTSLIFSSLRFIARGMMRAVSRPDRLTGACIFSVMVGLFIHGMFHEIYVNLTLWVFIGLGAVYATHVHNSLLSRGEST